MASLTEMRTKTISETIKEKVVEIVKDEETGEEKEVSKMVPKKVSKEVEYEYISLLEDFNKDENFIDLIDTMLAKKDTYSLIVGEDLITHPNADNLAKLCGLITKYTKFEVVIIPTSTNTLGVSQICTLSCEQEGFTVGYNEKADFELSALGDGDLDTPALNQQEGTFTNIDKKIIPTNAAVAFKGYALNNIANMILDVDVEYTIDYTSELPLEKGYQPLDFDSLPNMFGNDRVEYRGYDLSSSEVEFNDDVKEISLRKLELNENEIVIYKANPINQFNEFTAISHEFKDNLQSGIFFSTVMFDKLELEEGSVLKVSANNQTLELEAFIDIQIEGEIAYVSTFDKNSASKALFDTFRYNTAVVEKV